MTHTCCRNHPCSIRNQTRNRYKRNRKRKTLLLSVRSAALFSFAVSHKYRTEKKKKKTLCVIHILSYKKCIFTPLNIQLYTEKCSHIKLIYITGKKNSSWFPCCLPEMKSSFQAMHFMRLLERIFFCIFIKTVTKP